MKHYIAKNVLEELNNSIPSRNEDIIKAKEGATNTDFIGSMYAYRYVVVFSLECI